MIISLMDQIACCDAKNQIAISPPAFRKADAHSDGYLAGGNSDPSAELELWANVWRPPCPA
jgi:hypothetical protein